MCGFCVGYLFSDVVLGVTGVLINLAIILLGKRELVALIVLWLSVVCLFLAVPWVGLQYEIVGFSGHTL